MFLLLIKTRRQSQKISIFHVNILLLEEKQFFEIKVANFLVKIPFGPFVLKYIVSHYCS